MPKKDKKRTQDAFSETKAVITKETDSKKAKVEGGFLTKQIKENKAWAKLVPHETNPIQTTIFLGDQKHAFGRSPDCETVLPFDGISGHHCAISRQPTHYHNTPTRFEYVLVDSSMNGTYVEDQRISGASVSLIHRNTITFPSARGYLDFTFLIIPLRGEATTFRGKYQLGDQLGRGQFAKVYIARLLDDNQSSAISTVAVKIIDVKSLKNEKLQQNLANEIRVLRSINHPSIIQIFEVFYEEDSIYIVMEYVPGKEFFDIIYQKQFLPEAHTRHVFRQIFNAVKYLHDSNIVHRDLKPENILMADRENLTIKVADFGLAKILGDSDEVMNTICGTPTYVAPEMLVARPMRLYTSKVDMWSLGVILYICLCGRPPFSKALQPPSLYDQIRQGRYDLEGDLWVTISEEAKDLVRRLLEVNPANRFSVDDAINHPFMLKPDNEDDGPNSTRFHQRQKHFKELQERQKTVLLRRVKSEANENPTQVMPGVYNDVTLFSSADSYYTTAHEDGPNASTLGFFPSN